MKYIKAVLAALGIVVTVLTAALADNVIGIEEWQALAVAAVEAIAIIIAVVKTPNARFIDVDKLTKDTRQRTFDELELYDVTTRGRRRR